MVVLSFGYQSLIFWEMLGPLKLAGDFVVRQTNRIVHRSLDAPSFLFASC